MLKKYAFKKILTMLLFVCGSCVVSGCYGPPSVYVKDAPQEPDVQQVVPTTDRSRK